MEKATVRVLLLLSLFAVSTLLQTGVAVVGAQELPPNVDARQMPFFDQMKTRLAEYNVTADWTKKIFPMDESQLYFSESTVYIEVYVTDVEEAMQLFGDNSTDDAGKIFQVYRPTERAAALLSEIPHTYFYASTLSPSICLRVEKQVLPQIAEIPSVYCIRIIPGDVRLMALDSPGVMGNFALWIVLSLVAACVVLIAIGWVRRNRARRRCLQN